MEIHDRHHQLCFHVPNFGWSISHIFILVYASRILQEHINEVGNHILHPHMGDFFSTMHPEYCNHSNHHPVLVLSWSCPLADFRHMAMFQNPSPLAFTPKNRWDMLGSMDACPRFFFEYVHKSIHPHAWEEIPNLGPYKPHLNSGIS